MNTLTKKTILVTGGSGSLGRYIIKELLSRDAKNIISLSRDEGLIKDAKEWIGSKYVRFMIGDITDKRLVSRILKHIDIVFHAAALKDVPMAESHPREVLKVNVEGVMNLLDASEHVRLFMNISSDKTIGVVNCYGASKLLAEYLVRQTNDIFKGTYTNVRCPNFLGSRGSVLDVWRKQMKKRNSIDITDSSMTRFFITLPDVSKFIVDTAMKAKKNDSLIFYPTKHTKKFKLGDLAKAYINIYGNKQTKICKIGSREGEKLHENYVSNVNLVSVKELVKILRTLEY